MKRATDFENRREMRVGKSQMRHLRPLSTGLAALAALSLISLPVAGATSGSPYRGILDRNVFALKPAPPPPDPSANKPPEVPSNITLTGITTILGNKRALLHVSIPARAPEPAKEENYMLTEGQRDGSVEVLEINERTGSVKVNNAGAVTTLTFDKNGAKLMASAAPAPTPGQIPPPALGIPSVPNGGPGNPGLRTIPPRTMRSSESSSANQAGERTSNPNSLASQPQFNHSFTPEEQTLLIEAQRLRLQDQGKYKEANIFPITELTPEVEAPNGNISPQ